jgi:hypothetical protein
MRSVFAAILAIVLATSTASAAQLETFVHAVAGDGNGSVGGCFTYGPMPPIFSYFGSRGLTQPVAGYATCGYAATFRSQFAPLGTVVDAQSGNYAWLTNTLVGSTEALARYGEVSASANQAYAGQNSSSQVAGFQSLGRADDTFTITSPSWTNGENGSIRFHFSITGALSLSSRGLVEVEFAYYDGTVGPYTAFRSQATDVTADPIVITAAGVPLPGFTIVPGSISGSQVIPSLTHSFVYGTPRDWKFGLLTYELPYITGTMDSDWTAKITGIEIFGPSGQVVNDFTITSASGTTYTATGVVDTICANGIDDDGDGLIDVGSDPGCYDASAASRENPQCQNGLDDDGDGAFDFDGGALANGGTPLGPIDPQCTVAFKNREAPSACGLGGELALIGAALLQVRRAHLRKRQPSLASAASAATAACGSGTAV